MASSFPVKILAVTTKQAASEAAAYAELDKIVNDNPLSEIVTVEDGGYFPDMTKAVRMTNAIYRVNVPGYFYHHVKDPRVSGSKSSGILVSCYPSLIDSYIGLGQREHKCASKGGSGDPRSNTKAGTFGAQIFMSRGYNKESDINVRNKAGTKLKTGSEMIACIVNQRYGEVSKNSYRTTYAVNTGIVGTGGCLSNNMIPIVPGAGPTASIAGVSGVLDKRAIISSITSNPTGGKDSGSYTTDDGSKHSYKGAIVVTLSSNYKDACFEGRGTFVYWFHGDEYTGDAATADNDEYLFIPCAGVNTDCKPLTKIRDCKRRFNTTIATGGEVDLDISMWHQCIDAFDDHSDLNWVVLKMTSEPLGSPENATITNNTKRPNCRTDKKFRYLSWTVGKFQYTKGIIDANAFIQAFYNQSLKPRTGKFIVQRPYKLPPVSHPSWTAAKIYPSGSTAPSGTISGFGANSAWTKTVSQYLADFTLFDPRTDDEKTGHTIPVKFDVQKDLNYD